MKNVFITGIHCGLGHSLAKIYLQNGAHIYGLSRKPPKDLLEQKKLHYQNIDLSDCHNLEQKIHDLIKSISSLDLVILNAADIGALDDLRNTSMEQLWKTMNINVWSNKIICDTLFNLRIKVSQIIAISSGLSTKAHRGGNGYAISKAALNMLMSLYAKEQPQTHFCSLAPGVILTAMQESISTHKNINTFPIFQQLQQIKATMPSPDQVAQKLVDNISQILNFSSGSYMSLDDLKNTWSDC